ncbi:MULTISPECIES: S8 family peptidase [unclassified Streptomyces]|uniref:S8 family peptidase n=1 Tax=unclassified Streptomyces TaxID=2593676 RepID=UPI00225515D3|nr:MULTISPECIES: S8 family peptidase [unclassified Streptomyces]MCX5061045.1 S8 family peptidase [Streptomyces sp. NBC_00452]MCX5293330.1 S8 family peptidase [Streptomyces sp. NBC_00183]
MRRQVKRACAGTIATAAAVALAAGMTTPASAKAERSTTAPQTQITSKHRITLITGDRVVVDAKGRVVGLERAKGREHIPVQFRKADGHTLVVPADAARLVSTGKLDQRLFDITELNKSTTRRAQAKGLKVIVGYRGAASATKADVREAGTLRQTLKSLNADAVQTPQKETPELWDAVTNGDRTASGIAHVWLDGVRKASLDKSVPQIGAPKAWAAGYDGKGVKIAVLDTGVDATHPDLKTQVIESKNFSAAADATDHFGHGTHVASIVAGTGAKSNGKYKGVAPGAKILNGKVLDDSGFGDDSGIVAGMEWAAEQGADVVNLSLGAGDTPGVDPLEAEVNKLSEEKGILFAIAAGNSGPESVGSPGSAEDALTVGAVDVNDKLADFSSTGPTVDGTIKPDVTAPGVDITAAAAPGSVIDEEVGEKPPGYLTISGTSMATPHVAGAAALLKQQHPDWRFSELKGALTGSAKGGKYTAFQQGSGRIAVDKAIKQTVIADPVSVSFGVQQWPHTDDKPVTKQVTYRNLGTKDVTLNLAAGATDPKGQAAPSGFFKLGAAKVTVPAGGKASVGLTVNTKLGGTLDGAYSAYVTATGDGQSVRTAAAVQREIQSYSVTIKHIGRDGQPTGNYNSFLLGYSGLAKGRAYQVPVADSGTTTVRLPKGDYLLDASIAKDFVKFEGGVDWLVQPKLSVTKDTTVTIDARKTKAADITVPDAQAKQQLGMIGYVYDAAGIGFGLGLQSFADVRMAPLGGEVSGLQQTWNGQWTKGDDAEYDVATTAKVKKIQGDKVRHFKASELATVKNNLGSGTPGKTGSLVPVGVFPEDVIFANGVEQKLPGSRTLYLSTSDKIQWTWDFEQHKGRDADGFPIPEAYYTLGDPQTFKAGQKYTKTFNTAVFGPHLNAYNGLYREGNSIYGILSLFTDGAGHDGSSDFTAVDTALYRNGTKVGSNDDPLGGKEFKVPAGEADYRLTTSVKRSVKVAAASTRIDASWTFRSKKPSDLVKLPTSTVRFNAKTGLDNRVEAGRTVSVPVAVEGSAKGSNLKSLSVYVSYDYGQTWKKVDVVGGKIKVKNPEKGKAISFHAKITDKKNNKSTISIYNAYYGK